MAAITRLGFAGPARAYGDFTPKTPTFSAVGHTVRPAGIDAYVSPLPDAGLDVYTTGLGAGLDDVT